MASRNDTGDQPGTRLDLDRSVKTDRAAARRPVEERSRAAGMRPASTIERTYAYDDGAAIRTKGSPGTDHSGGSTWHVWFAPTARRYVRRLG